MRTRSVAARVLLGLSLTAFYGCQKESPTPDNDNTANPGVGVADANTSTVTINFPASVTVGQAVTFTGTAGADVAKVIVAVDGYVIKDMPVTNGAYTFAYTFNGVGANRALNVNAFSGAGAIIANASRTISVTSGTTPPPAQAVPYFYQYNNRYNPTGSCQNTSTAMMLKYYGMSGVTPDALSNQYGTNLGQSVSGLQQLFNEKAAAAGLKVRDRGTTTGTVTKLRQLLAAGTPVIVHGYFTNYGHVMVVTRFDGTYYYCNDPAGRWSQQYKYGGYSQNNATEGIGVRYGKAAFEGAVAPDGYVWLHEFYKM
ncbi:C39 family peptidase [Hymenobacter sp. BT664]|uniref:C39 family peptidase n=1 Tax=Hymenobacter montanus TaxID=2771359 RepID=A0A927BB05_9BACT|nr:C39 family peptidase [Hymenobacter montanus]MBD2766995.1 C39 family peptidase [Hymenobacter montanus]